MTTTVTADELDLALAACYLKATADTPPVAVAAARLTAATALAHAAPGAGFDHEIHLYRAALAQLTQEPVPMLRFIRTQTRHAMPRLGDIGEEQEETQFEPIPEAEPVKEPVAPTPTPAREPVPA